MELLNEALTFALGVTCWAALLIGTVYLTALCHEILHDIRQKRREKE
ncbi:membrane protein [Arthrobacter phage Snek]|uniref:Membrane protein n=1 Tax=Arthrobacter phage Tweety19 TaxID=2768133 RepID=A0A7G9W263_9CAUD|nr:membrane protein [Arthrobacter phage Tweety19]QNO12726.1 membrane protein [Arthrobacter phage Tweety19]